MRKQRPVANLVILLLGSAVSTFGNALLLVALLVHLAGFADSARLIGLVQGSAYLPMALFSYAAGAWVDRHSPRAVMIWTDALRGLAMIAGAFLLAASSRAGVGAAGSEAGLVVLLPLVFVMGTLQSFFIPGVVLLCVDIEHQLDAAGRRVRVLGLRNAGSHAANLAGNAIGGSLYLILGLPALLMFNGLGFILSTISEIFLRETPRSGKKTVSSTSFFPMADLRRVISTPPVDLYLLVQILIPFLTMVLPSFISQVLGLPAQALGLVFALLLAGSISAGLSSGLRGRYNKTIALQPGKAELLDSGQAYAADRSRPDVNQTKRGETRGKGQGEARGRDQGGDSRRVRYSGTKGAYLHGLLSGLLLIAIALPGKALPWPLGALLLVGLGYCLGSLYLYSVEAVQLAALPGRGGRGHGMLESLSSIVTPASYFIGAAVLGSAALGGGRVSASVWVVGLAVILAGYALLIPLFRRRPDTP